MMLGASLCERRSSARHWVFASLPRRNQRSPALCGCKKHGMDLYSDQKLTCTAHSGATKTHAWAVGALVPLFRIAGHVVRTQQRHSKRRPTAGRRGGQELPQGCSGQPEPGLRLVHHTRQDRQQLPRAAERVPVAQTGFRCASANGCAAKINRYRQQYADNQNISFLPAIMTTCSRLHGEFLRFLFLQAHRKTRAHFNATGLPSQQNRSDNAFRFKRAAFYMGLKSKVGLVAAKTSALRINLTIQGCSVVAPPLHAPSHAPLLLPLLLSHNIPLPRVH
jgi:hypothetical protein